MFVKPARPGLKVRDPKTKRHIPAAGKHVPVTSYWVRRLAAGDVVEIFPIPDSRDESAPKAEE